MNEEWNDIRGWEGYYQVSNLGRIKRLPLSFFGVAGGKRIVKSKGVYYPKYQISKKGYYLVGLCIHNTGKAQTKVVHRLVARAFHPNFSDDLQVDHIDTDKLNNHIDNLDMVTNLENLQRSHRYGSHSKRHGKPKLARRVLTKEKVSLIKEMYHHDFNKVIRPNMKKPFDQRWLAKCFKVSQNTIMQIVTNKSCYDEHG